MAKQKNFGYYDGSLSKPLIATIVQTQPDNIRLVPAQTSHLTPISIVYQQSIAQLCAADYDSQVIELWRRSKPADSRQTFIDNEQMWVALDGDHVTGFVVSLPGEILALFISPDYARLGIGGRLLKKGIELATRNGETTIKIESTLTAKEFCQRFGFSVDGEGTYSHGQSGLVIPVIYMSISV